MTRVLVLLTFVALGGAYPAAVRQEPIDQSTRLALLGKVWGLAKYFHPQVAEGTVDWDAALLEAIPRVKSAGTKAELNEELMRLIRAAGTAPRLRSGASVAQAESDPAFAWIEDRALLDAATIGELKSIRLAEVARTNRYVRPGSSQPDFSTEAAYDAPSYPTEGMRLLALFRFWNMIQYYAPNRDITDQPWSDVLGSFVQRFIDAADVTAYNLVVCELTAAINDTHAFTSSPTLTVHWGTYAPPLRTRFIESQTVVTRVFDRLSGGADIKVGDVITDVNGVPAPQLRESLRKYIQASNEGSLQRNIDRVMLGVRAFTSVTLGISRGGVARRVTVSAQALGNLSSEESILDGQLPKWRVMPGNIGYVHMGRLLPAEVPAMKAALAGTRGIVFDVRNYPQGTMYLIAEWLNPESRPFAKFTRPRYDRPGTMEWTANYSAGPATPRTDYYRGRIVLLGDDRTQSHAEFTMMALRTAPDVTVIGTPTSGADGNVSLIALPGSIRTYFSGLGVYYPDGSPTQRVGIVPDIVLEPTIRGIQAGVDELLDRAIAVINR
jgi:carboxyl-terminal processing protease